MVGSVANSVLKPLVIAWTFRREGLGVAVFLIATTASGLKKT